MWNHSLVNRIEISYSRLLLQFPSLYSGFSKCKMVFQNVDIDNDGGVTLEELKAGCAKLGYQLTDEELESTFAATDLNKNKVLDVKEFVVVLAILHMLGVSCCFCLRESNMSPASLCAWEAF